MKIYRFVYRTVGEEWYDVEAETEAEAKEIHASERQNGCPKPDGSDTDGAELTDESPFVITDSSK